MLLRLFGETHSANAQIYFSMLLFEGFVKKHPAGHSTLMTRESKSSGRQLNRHVQEECAMQRKKTIALLCGATVCVLWMSGLPALRCATQVTSSTANQTDTTPPKPKKPRKSTTVAPDAEPTAMKAKPPAPVKNASAEDIQSAKSAGKVWVNTESGVYHKSGKWFGTTKQGKFMTEQDAIKAGFRASKNEK